MLFPQQRSYQVLLEPAREAHGQLHSEAPRLVVPATGDTIARAHGWAVLRALHVTGVVAAIIFAGLAVLTLTMRPATRTAPAALPDYEATRS
jgi:DHA2 family multidrug resistance protein-like MFS transporter